MINLNKLKPGMNYLEIAHDSDCPAMGTGVGCVCVPDVYLVTKETLEKNIIASRKIRREAERDAMRAIKKAKKK